MLNAPDFFLFGRDFFAPLTREEKFFPRAQIFSQNARTLKFLGAYCAPWSVGGRPKTEPPPEPKRSKTKNHGLTMPELRPFDRALTGVMRPREVDFYVKIPYRGCKDC